ncbi:MAG: preprotein translocase subunit SecG [Clostridiaceae bacterium]|nr:preprotein translocase subunit SecG [Eubacteriales bacterium]
MGVAKIIINIVLIIVAVGLVTVVLVQQVKSAGLGAAYGGETTSFTPRGRAASKEAKLQKLTIILGSVMALLAIVMMILG